MTPWTTARQAFQSITNSQSLLKFTSIKLLMPSSHLILCHPLLPPSIFPRIRGFSNDSGLRIRRPKYWIFSFSISPFNEYSGLISCRMDWLDLRAVQGTLKSLLQHHSSKASILRHSAFFMVFTASTTYIYSNKEPMWEALYIYIYINTHTHVHVSVQLLSFLYSPTLTSIHDYWKNHSFD